MKKSIFSYNKKSSYYDKNTCIEKHQPINLDCENNSQNNCAKSKCQLDIDCKNKKDICCRYIVAMPGPTGATGTAGVLNYADFYALMPPDNAATVAPGTDVDFPQDGPNSGSGIARIGADSFNLGEIGTYQVLFQVSVTEAGQLVLTLNGAELAYTV